MGQTGNYALIIIAKQCYPLARGLCITMVCIMHLHQFQLRLIEFYEPKACVEKSVHELE